MEGTEGSLSVEAARPEMRAEPTRGASSPRTKRASMNDTRTRLVVRLTQLAPDLAVHLWAVRDVCDLPAEVRGAILDVLGHEIVYRGLDRDGTPNWLGRELGKLAEALGRDD